VEVSGMEAAAISYPEFAEDLAALLTGGNGTATPGRR